MATPPSNLTAKAPLGIIEFVILFGMITSLTALSIDTMLPALPEIGRELNVINHKTTQLIISILFLGMVFGEFLFGPLSDAIGRKKSILIGVFVFCMGTLICLWAQSIEVLLLGRFIQGVGVSGPKIASRALIRDQYEGAAMARIMSFVMMVFIMVPMIAPALGQLIIAIADWRAIFLMFLILAILSSIWLAIRQSETLSAERRIPISLPVLFQSTWAILRHVKIMAYSLTAGLVFAVLVVYLSTAQVIFQELYLLGDRFPLYFAILAFGTGFASLCNGHLVIRFGMQRLVIIALSVMTLTGIVLLSLSLYHGGVPPLSIFMSCCFIIFSCNGFLFANLNALAMQFLGRIAGLGAALFSSISSFVAVILAIIVGRLYNESLIPLASSFIVSGMLGLLLINIARISRAKDIELKPRRSKSQASDQAIWDNPNM